MSPAEALAAIRQAFANGRYTIGHHAAARMRTRRVSYVDIKRAVELAGRAETYDDPQRSKPPPHTSCWRVFGPDLEGDELAVAVDLTQDHLGYWVLVVTVF